MNGDVSLLTAFESVKQKIRRQQLRINKLINDQVFEMSSYEQLNDNDTMVDLDDKSNVIDKKKSS